MVRPALPPSLVRLAAGRAGLLVGAVVLATAVGGGTVAWATAGTPSPTPSVSVSTSAPPAAEQEDGAAGKGKGKGKGAGRPAPVPQVAFTCDPSKNHGQNVSAYVHSLPKGPGRGRQVSAVAKSDCGKR